MTSQTAQEYEVKKVVQFQSIVFGLLTNEAMPCLYHRLDDHRTHDIPHEPIACKNIKQD